jgi:hypothetical protein
MNRPLSLDEQTGTTWFQPDEDIPGVLEVVKNSFDEEKFANHQTRRLQEMLPGVPRATILAAVQQAMNENKKFTRELLLELRNTLGQI